MSYVVETDVMPVSVCASGLSRRVGEIDTREGWQPCMQSVNLGSDGADEGRSGQFPSEKQVIMIGSMSRKAGNANRVSLMRDVCRGACAASPVPAVILFLDTDRCAALQLHPQPTRATSRYRRTYTQLLPENRCSCRQRDS